jgi:predicted Fe-Mo cluster-binding NifX family protein
MKICVPSLGNKGLEEKVGEHFGRVPTYTIIDIDNNEIKIVKNTSEHMGGVGYPPEIMNREGVQVLVCSGIGRRAISMFNKTGIKVYIGATGKVKDAVNAFMQGNLQKAYEDDACQKHAFRNEQHHNHTKNHCK